MSHPLAGLLLPTSPTIPTPSARPYRVHHLAFQLPPEAEETSFPDHPLCLLSSCASSATCSSHRALGVLLPALQRAEDTTFPPIRPPSSPKPLAGGAGQAHALNWGRPPTGQICCRENQAVSLLLGFILCRKTSCLCLSAGASLECQVSEGKKQICGLGPRAWHISTDQIPRPHPSAHTPSGAHGPPCGPLPAVISPACRAWIW